MAVDAAAIDEAFCLLLLTSFIAPILSPEINNKQSNARARYLAVPDFGLLFSGFSLLVFEKLRLDISEIGLSETD